MCIQGDWTFRTVGVFFAALLIDQCGTRKGRMGMSIAFWGILGTRFFTYIIRVPGVFLTAHLIGADDGAEKSGRFK